MHSLAPQDDESSGRGQWLVIRQGRPSATPRDLYKGHDEKKARAIYQKTVGSMRQGSVEIVDPFGEQVGYYTMANCKTRW